MDETLPQQSPSQTPNQNALRRPVMSYSQPQEQKQKEETKYRITKIMGTALVVTALVIDIIEAILDLLGVGEVISPVLSVCADVLFIVWFWMLGMGLMKNWKNTAATFVQAIIGLIPALDILPELTLGILIIVLITRAEDRGGIIGGIAKIAQMKVGADEEARQVANSIRLDNMRRLQLERPNTQTSKPNAPASDSKNKAGQPNKPQTPNNGQQKQGATDQQSKVNQGIISGLKRDVDKYNMEIQELEEQLEQLKQKDRNYRESVAEMIRVKKAQGAGEEEIKKLETEYLRGLGGVVEMSPLNSRIERLKDRVFSTNNEIMDLERRAGKPMQLAA